jgi:hypothetical protein
MAYNDPLRESKRVQAASTRLHVLRTVLDPENGMTMAVSNEWSDDGAHRKRFVLRDVSALGIEGYQFDRLLIPRVVDKKAAQPHPPYFQGWGRRGKIRRVRVKARLGYYLGWDEEGDYGWQFRGVGNPEPTDIRGPDDPTLYDSLCPRSLST